MQIRAAQMEKLQADRVAGFEPAAVIRLKQRYPEIQPGVDDAFLRAFVRAIVRKAIDYEISDEKTLLEFLDCSFGAWLYVAGNDLASWLDARMGNLIIPAAIRVDNLRFAILEHFATEAAR